MQLTHRIWYGSALVGYNNVSTSRTRDEWDPIYPNVNDWTWDTGHGWYTHGGLIRFWMFASAFDKTGQVCYTPAGEPQDYLWVP